MGQKMENLDSNNFWFLDKDFGFEESEEDSLDASESQSNRQESQCVDFLVEYVQKCHFKNDKEKNDLTDHDVRKMILMMIEENLCEEGVNKGGEDDAENIYEVKSDMDENVLESQRTKEQNKNDDQRKLVHEELGVFHHPHYW